MFKYPKLDEALQNMTSLRNLTLDRSYSSILHVRTFTPESSKGFFSYVPKFLNGQSPLKIIVSWAINPSAPSEFKKTYLPNLTRVTTEFSRLPWLQRLVRCQAVSELTLLIRLRGLSDLAKLLDYMSRYPQPGPLLTPIFSSVTHLTTGIFPTVYLLEVREPPFNLFNDRILSEYVIESARI